MKIRLTLIYGRYLMRFLRRQRILLRWEISKTLIFLKTIFLMIIERDFSPMTSTFNIVILDCPPLNLGANILNLILLPISSIRINYRFFIWWLSCCLNNLLCFHVKFEIILFEDLVRWWWNRLIRDNGLGGAVDYIQVVRIFRRFKWLG